MTGTDATLSKRVWTLESGPSETGPWTLVSTYDDLDASVGQDGSAPWSTSRPTLSEDTYYRVTVQYNSDNASPVQSSYNIFKTGPI